MRQLWVVFAEELRRAWRSPGTYILLSLFFVGIGALYLAVLFQASVEPQRASPLQTFWEMQWLPNLFWVPLLTMRLLAHERKHSLLESTLATPTTPVAIVLGKYFSSLVLYLVGWLAVGFFVFITRINGLSPVDAAYVCSPAAVWGGPLFCAASGMLFLAAGLWCSSLTRNTIIAGALTVCLMLLYMFLPTMLGALPLNLDFLKPFSHLDNLSDYVAGQLSLSMIVAYAVASLVLLFATALSIERRAE